MKKDESKALFTQLGRMEEKLDSLSGLKADVKANTKFRWFATAFVIITVSFIGVAYKAEKLIASTKNIDPITEIIDDK